MDVVGGVGRTLRQAREQRGLTIEQISTETKVPEHYLAAIEDDRLDALPAPVYVRGLVRLYASAVELSPEEMVAQLEPRWRGQSAEPPAPDAPASTAMPPPPRVLVTEPERDFILTHVTPAGPEPASEPVIGVNVSIPPPVSTVPPLIDDLGLADTNGEVAPLAHATAGRRRRSNALAGAGAAIAMVAVVAVVMLNRAGDAPPGRQAVAAAAASASAAVEASPTPFTLAAATTATATPPTATPTLTPTPNPTQAPTPTPSRIPAAVDVPAVPSNPFAQCASLGGDAFDCGPGPWRVICTPFGSFVDIKATVPRPVPPEWTGWRETAISGRLETLYGAC